MEEDMQIMRRLRNWAILCLALGILISLQAIDSEAMTAFSRKYQTSCITCHTVAPRLNGVGESYRINGYRFANDEMYRKQDPLELGNEAYKRLWPKTVWPGNIPSMPPISFVTKWIMEYNHDPVVNPLTLDQQGEFVFILPHELELAWAGPIGDHISGYGDMIFFQDDFGSSDVTAWLAIKARVEFQDLFGPENMFNLSIGSVGVHSIGLYTARTEQALSIQTYSMYSWSMPTPKEYQNVYLFGIDIQSFSGNKFNVQAQTGAELHGFGKNWLYYAGVVNGNIKNPLYEEPHDTLYVFGQGTNSDFKDYYAGFAYKFGGIPLDGSNLEGREKLPSSTSEFWRDDSLTVSLFGYLGNWIISQSVWADDPTTIPDEYDIVQTDDRFYRLAMGALWRHKDLTLNCGYMFGRNENPYGLLDPREIDSHAWFVEGHYFFYPWLVPYARFDSLRFSDFPTDTLVLWDEQGSDIVTLGIKALLRANISLQTEFTAYTYDGAYDYPLDESLFFMLVTSF